MNNELTEVGRRLKYIRKQAGISRKALAEKHDIAPSTIQNWETGAAEIGALKLASYLAGFQEFGIYVDFNTIMNRQQIPALETEPDKLQALQLNLKGLKESNVLFYTQPDGFIVYFNPQYRHIVSTDYKNQAFTLLHLNNVFGVQNVQEILEISDEKKTIDIIQLVQHSTIQLKLELQPDLDINNHIMGIAGFVLPCTMINNVVSV